uniref:Uncharacterized protein n=1 Tax=Anopheles atroparvus TaxID=41427 RepID=A0A182IPT4_ANOAO
MTQRGSHGLTGILRVHLDSRHTRSQKRKIAQKGRTIAHAEAGHVTTYRGGEIETHESESDKGQFVTDTDGGKKRPDSRLAREVTTSTSDRHSTTTGGDNADYERPIADRAAQGRSDQPPTSSPIDNAHPRQLLHRDPNVHRWSSQAFENALLNMQKNAFVQQQRGGEMS